jgi:hypothetical protein
VRSHLPTHCRRTEPTVSRFLSVAFTPPTTATTEGIRSRHPHASSGTGRREPRSRRLPRASSAAGRWEPRPPPSCKLRRGEDGAAAAVLAPAPPRGEGSRSLQLRRGEDGAAASLTPSRKLRCGEVGAAVVALVQAPPRGRWWSSFRSFFQIARVIIAKCRGGSVFFLLPWCPQFFHPRPIP